ncbi:MAG: hypothetical protein AAB409_09020 [Gemmatimonadota bacterium]
MAWSGILIGLMPYALALVVLGVVLHNRRRASRRAADDSPR